MSIPSQTLCGLNDGVVCPYGFQSLCVCLSLWAFPTCMFWVVGTILTAGSSTESDRGEMLVAVGLEPGIEKTGPHAIPGAYVGLLFWVTQTCTV